MTIATIRSRHLLRSVLLCAALVLGMSGAGLLTASAASAAPFKCTDRDFPQLKKCAHVTAIDSGSYLAFHNQPNYSSPVTTYNGKVVKHHNGDTLYLSCWTTGAGDADGHGDTYWFSADDGITDGGLVNDYYVTSGSPSDWKPYIKHC